jgi:2'-5' RNA ligase
MQQKSVRHVALFFISEPLSSEIDTLRRLWDPKMAARLAAHVTLIYSNEVSDVDLLKNRILQMSRTMGPFRVHLGRAKFFGSPTRGIYVMVDDIDKGISRLREQILQPPLTDQWKPYLPHVTLLHPRSAAHGEQAWESLKDVSYECDIYLERICLIEDRGSGWVPIAEYTLSRDQEGGAPGPE